MRGYNIGRRYQTGVIRSIYFYDSTVRTDVRPPGAATLTGPPDRPLVLPLPDQFTDAAFGPPDDLGRGQLGGSARRRAPPISGHARTH